MIKIPKKRLFKLKAYLRLLEKYPPVRIFVSIFLFILLYVLFPFELAFKHGKAHVTELVFFYIANLLILFFILNKNNKRTRRLTVSDEGLQEATNLLQDEIVKEKEVQIALKEKIERYNRLKNIIEGINLSLNLDNIADSLASISFSVLGNNKGTCLLYLIDNQTQKLTIFKSIKENKSLVIKAKEGDIFDFWVLRHASPLLIEDIKKDFRFDSEQVKSQYSRPIQSLISVPFISDHRFLGILRLDSSQAGVYSQEDLRFLLTISELGAVALENGELFQKTQDLAIHDDLTSLYRKGYFTDRLKEEVKKCMRKKSPISLLILDIDYFKKYNDQFGHTAGDIVLRNLSQNMIDSMKDKSAIIGRFGGEEFSAALLGVEKKEAVQLAEGLRQIIEKNRIVLRRQETKVTASIGVATFPDDAGDEVELMIKADRALYTAKQKGRNRVIGA